MVQASGDAEQLPLEVYQTHPAWRRPQINSEFAGGHIYISIGLGTLWDTSRGRDMPGIGCLNLLKPQLNLQADENGWMDSYAYLWYVIRTSC